MRRLHDIKRAWSLIQVSVGWATAICGSGVLMAITAPPSLAITNGTDIADTVRPEVGFTHAENGDFNFGGTGTLIQSNIEPTTSFVLTAAHNLRGYTKRGFLPKGASGGLSTKVDAEVLLHPDYLPTTDPTKVSNDLAIMKLASVASGVAPAALYRDPVKVSDTLLGVGFGDPQDPADYPTKFKKRQGDFKVTGFDAQNTLLRAATKTADKLPTGEHGDSGGPWFEKSSLKVAGVMKLSTGFNGGEGGVDSTYATAVYPYLDWIDSHTRKSIFWDRLVISRSVVDDFEDYPEGKGIATGWDQAAVMHPTFGEIRADSADWRYIHALGFNEPPAQPANQHAQGEIMQGDKPSAIKRKFTVEANKNIEIDLSQRWNSLGLATDLGIQLGDGDIKWQGVWKSHLTDQTRWLNSWLSRTVRIESGAATMMTLFLVNAAVAVPEPTTVASAWMCLILLLSCRRCSAHPSQMRDC